MKQMCACAYMQQLPASIQLAAVVLKSPITAENQTV